ALRALGRLPDGERARAIAVDVGRGWAAVDPRAAAAAAGRIQNPGLENAFASAVLQEWARSAPGEVLDHFASSTVPLELLLAPSDAALLRPQGMPQGTAQLLQTLAAA